MILRRVKVVKGAEAVHRLTPESFGVSASGLEPLEGLMERASAHYYHLDEIVSAHDLGETPRPFLDNLHSEGRYSHRNATGLGSWLSEVSLNSKRHRQSSNHRTYQQITSTCHGRPAQRLHCAVHSVKHPRTLPSQ
jgi:hypothetical protein